VLGVDEKGRLLAVGQEGELTTSGGSGVRIPPGWDYRLDVVGGVLVAHGRDRLATVSNMGDLDQVPLERPAQVEPAAGWLHLFFTEGDYLRLVPGGGQRE
jgi:hypothetical protein